MLSYQYTCEHCALESDVAHDIHGETAVWPPWLAVTIRNAFSVKTRHFCSEPCLAAFAFLCLNDDSRLAILSEMADATAEVHGE